MGLSLERSISQGPRVFTRSRQYVRHRYARWLSSCRGSRPHHMQKDRIGSWEVSRLTRPHPYCCGAGMGRIVETLQPSGVFTTSWFIRKRIRLGSLASRGDHKSDWHVQLHDTGLQLNHLEFIEFRGKKPSTLIQRLEALESCIAPPDGCSTSYPKELWEVCP
jgi:hypothetical protein